MKNFFNYDNKFMSVLSTLGDFMIINILFVICCLPVFTIGAAQAGMFTAMRVHADKEDDSSLIKAFFRGFTNGFGTVTIAFSIILVVLVAVGYSMLVVTFGENQGSAIMAGISLAGFFLCAMFQPLVSAFHSRFKCTVWQLFRNSWLLFLAQPLHSVLVGLLAWSPLFIFLLSPKIFMMGMPVLLSLYFSLVYWLCQKVLKKPFGKLEALHYGKEETKEEASEEN